MEFCKLELALPVVSARGAKSCALTDGSAKCILTVGSRDSLLTTPFGACSFGEEQTSRKHCELRLPPQWLQYFENFDAWAITYLAEHSERLFKKLLTTDQVKEMYKPCAGPILQRCAARSTLVARPRCDVGTHLTSGCPSQMIFGTTSYCLVCIYRICG